MDLHIGQLIKEQLEKSGMKKTEFARRINITSQNVYHIFTRKSIDTGLLESISDVLKFNFFESLEMHYSRKSSETWNEMAQKYGSATNLMEALEKANRDLNTNKVQTKQLQKEVDYLKEINRLLQKNGH